MEYLIILGIILFALHRYRNADSVEIDGRVYHIDGSGRGRR